MTDPSELVISPLTLQQFANLAALFDEGGDPKWCWCSYFRVRGRSWSNATPAGNRAELERLAAVANSDRQHAAPGLVAYRGGRAIGWVSLAPRDEFERLAYSKVLAPIDGKPVWSIVCFVVSRRSRGGGVAVALLDAAIDYAAAHGSHTLEAYPVDTGVRRVPSASLYHGTLAMFTRAGFTVATRRQANASSPVRPIVRLEIGADQRGASVGSRRPGSG